MSLELYMTIPTTMSGKCFSVPIFLPSCLRSERCLSAEVVYAMCQTLLPDIHIRTLLCPTARSGESMAVTVRTVLGCTSEKRWIRLMTPMGPEWNAVSMMLGFVYFYYLGADE
ncbi:hypothetical protein IEO21_01951 [Rhodonia placenta]|uniref:Uncharacterized protein n=1 Tax=Rhodonia placenta TaxID=104341 RepID=A0A8H7P8S8_9APHY|nr:hypothetical protein IEO21_01951 [Postia placenta]